MAAGRQRRALSITFLGYHSVSRLLALAKTDFWSIFKTSTAHTVSFCTSDPLLRFHKITSLMFCVFSSTTHFPLFFIMATECQGECDGTCLASFKLLLGPFVIV